MQDWAANYWLYGGTPNEKLIIGMATYGRGFTLADANNNGYGAAATGPSPPGQFTREGGFYSYYEASSNDLSSLIILERLKYLSKTIDSFATISLRSVPFGYGTKKLWSRTPTWAPRGLDMMIPRVCTTR